MRCDETEDTKTDSIIRWISTASNWESYYLRAIKGHQRLNIVREHIPGHKWKGGFFPTIRRLYSPHLKFPKRCSVAMVWPLFFHFYWGAFHCSKCATRFRRIHWNQRGLVCWTWNLNPLFRRFFRQFFFDPWKGPSWNHQADRSRQRHSNNSGPKARDAGGMERERDICVT